jgi:hypothetical protein
MVRYPNKAVITWKPSTLNEATGDYSNGAEQQIIIDCRIEPSNPAQKVIEGSKIIDVSYKLYTSDNCALVPQGAICDVSGTKRKVLKVHTKQVNTEIWL